MLDGGQALQALARFEKGCALIRSMQVDARGCCGPGWGIMAYAGPSWRDPASEYPYRLMVGAFDGARRAIV